MRPTAFISYSQAKRIYQRYLTGGDKALVHGNTGKPSNNKTDEETVKRATELYRERYCDFGPTLAQEMLCERDGLEISVSALRRALVSAGLWKQKKTQANTGAAGRPVRVSGNLSSLTAAVISGLKSGGVLLPYYDDR